MYLYMYVHMLHVDERQDVDISPAVYAICCVLCVECLPSVSRGPAQPLDLGL